MHDWIGLEGAYSASWRVSGVVYAIMLALSDQASSWMKGEAMASLDDIRQKAEAAIDQAKPFVEGAINAGAQFAEKADEWASGERPGFEGAFKAAGAVAAGAVDALADGANVAYEFVKDKVEEATGKDIDGDGQVGKIKPEDVVAGAELAAEAVADKVDKAVAEISSMTPENAVASAELASEAVAGAVAKAAGNAVAAKDLAAEALADKVDRVAGDVAAGAELVVEALTDDTDFTNA